MNRLSLVEDLQSQSANGHAVLFIEGIFPSQLQRGTDYLFPVQVFAAIENLADKLPQDSIPDSHAGNQDFVHSCLMNNSIEHGSRRRNNVGPIRSKMKLSDAFFDRHALKPAIDELKFRRAYSRRAVLVEEVTAKLTDRL